jgi:Predicted membrane protein
LPSEEDEATASGSDSEPEPAPHQKRIPSVLRSPEAAPQPKAPEAQVPKGGLGKIGGKNKKEAERRPSPSPSPAPSPALVREAPKRLKGGLGMIGGKKKQAKEPSPSQAPSPPEKTHESPEPQEPSKSLEEKERIDKDHHHPTSSTQQPAAKAKRTGKLGTIGGKAKAKVSEPARDKSPLPTSDTVVRSFEKTTIAKPKADRQAPKKEESPLPTPATEKVSSAPPEEPETEDQRADRKREELKRSLEAKGKAPAKKKRRF